MKYEQWFLGLLFLGVIIVGCFTDGRRVNYDNIMAGRYLARDWCARCHSPSGGSIIISFQDIHRKMKRRELKRYMKNDFMTNLDKNHSQLNTEFSDTEIESIISYIESF